MSYGNEPRTTSPDRTEPRRLINVPNALCLIRLILSLALLPIALLELRWPFLVVFLLAASTDWIDGKLAIWLKQRTTFGAGLDSVADATMYGALLFGCVWLEGEALWENAAWIATALASYVLACGAALIKFRRLSSYHMYSAKFAWMITVLAAIALLTGWAVWPLRVAAVAVTLANLEAAAITFLLDRWRVDIRSVLEVKRQRESG